MNRPDVEGMKARADRGDSHVDAGILARYAEHLETLLGLHGTPGQCSVCQSCVPTRAFAYRTDGSEPEWVIGQEMPLDDPRTWHLCYVCANTHISASNQQKYKTENRILGALTNLVLDAIATGEDPRAGWGTPGEQA